MDETTAVREIVQNVLLNFEGQQKWVNDTPDYFLASCDTYARQVSEGEFDRVTLFRAGVIIGGLYERWKAEKKEVNP